MGYCRIGERFLMMIVVVNDLCSLSLCGQVLMIVGVNHLLGVVIVSFVFLCVCACLCVLLCLLLWLWLLAFHVR
jgi:hypothetical protein